MKKTKLKGYIYDLEHKNKKFSFNKTMKILDISNAIYLDQIDKIFLDDVSSYKKSKYMFKEINNELSIVFKLLEDENVLSSVCLLRNVYEEILYIMATSVQTELDINIKTRAGYFKEIVCNHIGELLSDNFEVEDINELYSYMSQITHVTNIKEVVSYLIDKKNIKKYIVNEIKYILIVIEAIYLDFINKKCNKTNNMNDNILLEASYVEWINMLYFSANISTETKKLKVYFYGEKNQKYITERNELTLNAFNDMKKSKNKIRKTINKVAKELDEQIKQNGYIDIANKILNTK